MTEQEIYQKAMAKFGNENQVIKTIEELSELQKALCKMILYCNNEIIEMRIVELEKNILEEMADVEIMVNQLKFIFGSTETFESIKQAKLKRLQGLL